jgi:hypothetical protein
MEEPQLAGTKNIFKPIFGNSKFVPLLNMALQSAERV